MEMGDIIKSHRLRLGLSQQELGERVGVNKAAVQKWEKGTVENMKRSTIKILADLFGICPAELLGWGDEYNECIVTNIQPENSKIHNNGVIGTVNGGKLTFKNNEAHISETNKTDLNAQEQDLLRIFSKANGKQQMQIMQFVYSIEEEIDNEREGE